jgi:flavin reductase (DIM6/NTAB) family NADH-FMN oxidoreductase RutF
MRRHASAVTIVTAPAIGSLPQVGFTATSFTSVSLRPQIVSFCLDRDATSRPTVERARHVAIHVLSAGQVELARTFATRGIDRFADTTVWQRGPYGMALLHNVAAALVCEADHPAEVRQWHKRPTLRGLQTDPELRKCT